MFAKLAAIALAVTAALAGQAPAAQPEPTAAVQTVDHYAAARMRQSVWVADQLNTAGIAIPANVTIMFNDSLDNCGDQISPEDFGGGCTYHWHDGTVSVLLSASIPTDKYGAHILFHELGHALYNLGECGAEYFAHHYDNTPNVWSYQECAK